MKGKKFEFKRNILPTQDVHGNPVRFQLLRPGVRQITLTS